MTRRSDVVRQGHSLKGGVAFAIIVIPVYIISNEIQAIVDNGQLRMIHNMLSDRAPCYVALLRYKSRWPHEIIANDEAHQLPKACF
jgi:hypothetical protein